MSTSDPRGPARASGRPSAGRAYGLVALVWAVAVAFVLTVASDTRLGPVVYKFTRTHGVHLGDVYATLGCAAVALLLSIWVIMDHGNRKRLYQRYLQRRQAGLGEEPHAEPDDIDPDEQQTVIVSYEDLEPFPDPGPADGFDYYERGVSYDHRPRQGVRGGPEATEEIPRTRHALGD